MNTRRDRSLLIRTAVLGALLLAACAAAGPSAPTAAALGAPCGQGALSCNVVSGYVRNSVDAGSTGATISGGGEFGAPNRVDGDFGVVGGGRSNVAAEGAVVGGGAENSASAFHATVGGGANNSASAEETTIAGGFKNVSSEHFAAVGGGALNIASDWSTTVAGGSGNIASFTFAAVGGGTQNVANSTASVVAGGDHNLAQGAYSSVLGGLNNNADGYLASIGGGAGNTASGYYATVPGGFANSAAAAFSFAAGDKAEVAANHRGTFLFADSSGPAFPSLGPNEFAVRATGGFRFVTAIDPSGAPLAGVRLTAGSGTWETLSDANAKAGFTAVDDRQVLEALMRLPIQSWYYRSQDPSIRHIGPTAQDFTAAFKVGEDPHYISTVDADGVALASIQALYRMVQASPAGSAASMIQTLQQRLLLSNVLSVASLIVAILALWRRPDSAAAWPSRLG